MRWLLLFLSALALLAASLPFVRLPDTTFWWKVVLGVTEFGHWLVLFPLGLAGLAWFASEGAVRGTVLALCALSVAGGLWPAFSAARLTGTFSWKRLWFASAGEKVPVRTEVYARPGGQELTLDFYAPPFRKDTTRRPGCLVVIHGGGWDSGDNSQLVEWNHRWAAHGWAVAAINYRLAPQHPWPAQREDVQAAIAWLKTNADRFALDPSRLVVLGRSAGGQIATAVSYGAHDPAIRGVVALYAPHDMKFAWGVSREDDALNSVRLMRQYLGGPPDTPERNALYESASGQLLARNDSPPTLLIHGFPDRLVWYRHSRRLAARLAELGVSCTHVELPWATHAFDYNADGPGGQVADAAIAEFLNRVGR
ncbi:alpha/beta hydrolase [Oleiharenicola lentus]|jgi:acetyl esterase/lipase|uniref:Alpha/beta hydrolase n=1 Tax=Oleiharenicola lentus TaxID=2508720 RepID=A0A4Q1C7T3_9BACT|nr:alpha/beta hydrolase [Oleiharenicola lentus]RXK54886.1 alpha/beta hydrolase [Oleiharenicola lentus]